MNIIESNIEWAIENNSQLQRPTKMHTNREKFFKLLPKIGFERAVEKALKISFYSRVINKIKCLVKTVKK